MQNSNVNWSACNRVPSYTPVADNLFRRSLRLIIYIAGVSLLIFTLLICAAIAFMGPRNSLSQIAASQTRQQLAMSH
jgi:hypothetical protein